MVSVALLKIVVIAAQILYRTVLRPQTEMMEREIWEACMYPGGYRLRTDEGFKP